MEQGWVKIFSTQQAIQAEILKGMLEENNIAAVVINKQASSYMVFGEAELYVSGTDVIEANFLIHQNNQ